MTMQIGALHTALCDQGFQAKIWQDRRIYLNGYGRDIKAWLSFDDATREEYNDIWSGVALHVRSDCVQHPQWLINRAKQVKHQIMQELYGSGITKIEPCDDWRDVI